MDDVSQWILEWKSYYELLEREGFVDGQFKQLMKLQDESTPDFAKEVVSLFFEDSQKLLANMAEALKQQVVDFKQLGAYVHQFKGSSASVGAPRISVICVNFKNASEAQNREGCGRFWLQIQQECESLKNKLDYLFNLEQGIVAAGGSIPDLD